MLNLQPDVWECVSAFLHSSDIAVPWENNFPFKHLLLRRMLEALNALCLGTVVVVLELF